MATTAQLTRLVEIIKAKKILEEEEKRIRGILESDIEFKDTEAEGYNITRVITRRVGLKKGYDQTIVAAMFPTVCQEVTTIKIDMDALEKMPEAHDIIEIGKSVSIRVAEKKEKKEDILSL